MSTGPSDVEVKTAINNIIGVLKSISLHYSPIGMSKSFLSVFRPLLNFFPKTFDVYHYYYSFRRRRAAQFVGRILN